MRPHDLERLDIELQTLRGYLLSFAIYALMALIAIIWSVDPESIRFKSMTGFYLTGAVVMMMFSAGLLKIGLKSRHKSMVAVVLGLQLLGLLTAVFGSVDESEVFGPDIQFFILAAVLDCLGVFTTLSSIDHIMRLCHASD